jgi:hypothetical protein
VHTLRFDKNYSNEDGDKSDLYDKLLKTINKGNRDLDKVNILERKESEELESREETEIGRGR